MNIDTELILNILSISITSGIISTQLIQYIKDNLKINNTILFSIISFLVGTLFAISFSGLNLVESLWCGFVSIIGSENLYKIFKGHFGLKSSE